MELTRKQVIEELKAILETQYWNVPLSKAALEYAINSLKTDEAYQLMYEGEDIYIKADMVAMLEDLDLQIDELASYNLEVAKVQRLIRDRIKKLKLDVEIDKGKNS